MSHLLLQKLFRVLEDPPIQNEPSSPTGSIEEDDATQGAEDPPISNKQVKTAEDEKRKKEKLGEMHKLQDSGTQDPKLSHSTKKTQQ
jgi:hypothetical protein